MESEVKVLSMGVTRGLASRLLVIAVAMTFVFGVVLAATVLLDLISFPFVMAAFGLCLVSSLMAHVAGEYPKGPEYFAHRMVGSMVARTALPIAACLVFRLTDFFPFDPGFVFLVITFYLVGLVVDVRLQASRLKSL